MADRKTVTKARSLSPKQLGVRLPADMTARLQSIARAEHNGVSAVVRRLLTVALATAQGGE